MLTWYLLNQKMPLSVCQKEHFTGLFEIRSCLQPVVPWRSYRDCRKRKRIIVCGKPSLIVWVFYWLSLPSQKILFRIDGSESDRERQVLSCQRMVCIQSNCGSCHVDHSY